MKKSKLIIFIFITTLLFMINGCMKSESVDNSKVITTSPSPTSVITVAPTIRPTIEPSTAPIIAPTTVPTVTPIIQTGTLDEQSMDAYKKFMENKAKVSFDRYMPMDYSYRDNKSLYNKGSDYTLSEVLDIVTVNYFDIFTNKKIDYLDYSYIDCGKDGVNELVIRFNGMDIYCEDDDSTLVYIIKYIDGKLYLCYYYETWVRRDASINEYGHYQSGGSNGASNHGYDSGVIDKDGNWQFIVYIESETDICQLTWSDELGQIPEVAETKEIYDGIELDTIRFNNNENVANVDEDGNKEYYTFYVFDDKWNLIEDANLYTDSIYKDIFDEASVAFITPDEVSAMISEKEEKVGATAEIIKGKEVIWKTVSGNIFSDYLESKVKLDTLVKNGLQVFEEQSFDVKLDDFGYVRFVSGVDGHKNLRLYLVNSNKEIIYVFPGFNVNKLSYLQEVAAVSFKDINKDGLKDITIIAHCLAANGGELTMANVYFQKDKGFMNSYVLDGKINDTNNNNSINEVIKYVSGLNLSTFGIK